MKLTERAPPVARLADDGAHPTLAAKRRSSECAWTNPVGALCSLCTESLAEYMHIRTIHILLLAILLLGGCSDTVSKHYSTRAEAEADSLFERGWLPSLIPATSKDIKTSNNIDINISEGEFRYDLKETNEFLNHLKPYTGQKPKLDRWQSYIVKQKKEGYDPFEYAADENVWVFLVNTRTGHVRYVMW